MKEYWKTETGADRQYRRLRDLREDHDWTQQKVSDYLSVARRTYANYESGQRTIPSHMLCALADL